MLPNVSSVEESGNTYINGRFTSKQAAEAGTIIAYHEHSTGEYEVKYIVPEAYGDPYWKADAIVVVPYSHTGDGTVRAMGLNYASLTTPSTGGDGDSIMWGAYMDNEELQNYSGCIKFSNYNDQTFSSYGINANANLPSDSFTNSVSGDKVNPYDRETGYKETVSSNFAPSPYNEDGSKNDAYHSLGAFVDVTENGLKDMDGKDNTLKILRNLNPDYLSQTLYAGTLANAQTHPTYGNLFPAACACARYSSVLKPCSFDPTKTLEENITTMPWYLPSCGELGYVMVRLARIQYALSQVGAITLEENTTWSSSKNDTDVAWLFETSAAKTLPTPVDEPYLVRPFVAY